MQNLPILIGQSINLSSDKKLKESILKNDMSYLYQLALNQKKRGIKLIDISLGGIGIDEKKVAKNVLKFLNERFEFRFVIDSMDYEVISLAVEILKDKNPIINSINIKDKNFYNLLKLAKKYNLDFVSLCMDENGVLNEAKKRFYIAKEIVEEIERCGIKKEKIILDPLCMPIKYYKNADKITIETLRLINKNLKVKTTLGISNISYGLSNRKNIDFEFFKFCIFEGLSYAIIDPFSDMIMDIYR